MHTIRIAIPAMFCGADDWTQVTLSGRHRAEWLKSFLPLPGGIPSHDTFQRVFDRLDRRQFAAALFGRLQALHQATDGRRRRLQDASSQRGAGRGLRPLHHVPDVTFDEDHRRQSDRRGAANLAASRRLVSSIPRQEKTHLRGTRCKRFTCALDPTCLNTVLDSLMTADV